MEKIDLAELARVIRGFKEEDLHGVVVQTARVGNRIVEIVLDMDDFNNNNNIDEDNLTVIPDPANTNRIIVTPPFDKGSSVQEETGAFEIATPEIKHHDFAGAAEEVRSLGLHPINFINVSRGVYNRGGYFVDSDLDLAGLPHALHGAVALEQYLSFSSRRGSESLIAKALLQSRTDIFRQFARLYPGLLNDEFKGVFSQNFLGEIYRGSSIEDRKSLEPFMRAEGIHTQVFDLDVKLFLKTAELGNRLVNFLQGDTGGFMQIAEIKPSEHTEMSFPRQKDVEKAIKSVKSILTRKIDNIETAIQVYNNAVSILSRMPLRLNGKILFSNFPREITLAKIAFNSVGESVKLSAYKKFEEMGFISSVEELNLNKIKDSERISQAIATADLDIDILSALENYTPILVIDTSGSMEYAVDLLHWLSEKINGIKPYTVILFGNGQIRVREKSTSHDFSRIKVTGDTPLFPALDVAFQVAEREKEGNPIVILISDLDPTATWWKTTVLSSEERKYEKEKPQGSNCPLISVYAQDWGVKEREKKALVEYHANTKFVELPGSTKNEKKDKYVFLSKLYSALKINERVEYWVEKNTLFIRRVK